MYWLLLFQTITETLFTELNLYAKSAPRTVWVLAVSYFWVLLPKTDPTTSSPITVPSGACKPSLTTRTTMKQRIGGCSSMNLLICCRRPDRHKATPIKLQQQAILSSLSQPTMLLPVLVGWFKTFKILSKRKRNKKENNSKQQKI